MASLLFPAAGPGAHLIQADTLPQRFQCFNSVDTYPNRASLAWTRSLDHCCPAVGCAVPLRGRYRAFGLRFCMALKRLIAGRKQTQSCSAALQSIVPICFPFSCHLLWPLAFRVRAWVLGGVSGAAERCLLCLSSSLAEALPNHRGFGEEEARQGRKGPVYPGGMRGR